MATSRSKSSQTSRRTSRSGSKSSSTGSSRKSSPKTHSTKASSRTAAHRTSAARKTGRKTAYGQASTDQHSGNPSSTGHGKAKKEPARQTSQCWPGYEPVPGKARGTKGSCKPKAHQTAAEKKSDAMAASASKLRKAGGNKARANHSK